MKKRKIVLVFFALALLFGCKDKSAKTDAGGKVNVSSTAGFKGTAAKIEVTLDEDNKATFKSLSSFFTPDYSPVLPEKSESEKKAIAQSSDKKKESSESVVQSVRKMSDYQTKYSVKRMEIPSVVLEEDDDYDESGDLFVEDWGPQGKVVAEEEHPCFYVIFSQPVRALSADEEPSQESDVMEIYPPLKGTYRWYGTRHISFEADEPCDPSREYRIAINSSLKSLKGKPITGQIDFSTEAEPIKISNFFGGYIKDSMQAYSWDTGALPSHANCFYIRLNCQTTEERLSEVLQVKVGEKLVPFTVKADQNEKAFRWYTRLRYDEEKHTTNSFIVTINSEIPYGTTIHASTDGKWSSYHSCYTLKPLTLSYMPPMTEYSSADKKFPLHITFNQKLDKESVYKNIMFNFDFTLNSENCLVEGKNVTIYNMPVNPGESYVITLGGGLKDAYGQSLSRKDAKSYTFDVPDTRNSSYVKYLDYGAKMMEAQFPHKILFEYQNAEPHSYFKVSKTDNPFDTSNFISAKKGEGLYSQLDSGANDVKIIDPNVRAQRCFEEIDLDQYLNGGYGFVKFEASTVTKDYNWWREEYENYDHDNVMTVQVTDLGITARLAINRAVFMVRSLSTGKPVADADVYIFLRGTTSFDSNSNYLARGKTDKNGLAVIDYTEDQIKEYENSLGDKYYDDTLYAMVQKGNDRAVFSPSSHNNWAFDVYSGSRYNVRNPVQRTFMFVDRGIYKPGETVTFRGIDRDQILGAINPHKGNYTITVSGGWWNAPEITAPIYGSLSASGGFYGSFKIPDDLEPGSYRIKFVRDEKKDNSYAYESVYFTVANFERLKIESSISVPDMTYYGGDKLSAELSADYLAGGSLNGADYSVSWYKQETSFSPNTVETNGFRFGPNDYSSGRTYYSDATGKLNSNGQASLTCTSEKITTGNPFVYRVEASVTDVSNQRISAQNGITVHSSLFYAGLKKPANMKGFGKKGEKLEFPYILVNTDGVPLASNELSFAKNLSFTLDRDEWTMVHEQSVDDTVYTRYEKQTVTDASGSVKISSSGTISVTPVKAGWHTLSIKGQDKLGNPVITQYGFYVTGGDTSWYDRYNSEAISLTADQSEYNPGDVAQVLLESPLPSGDYLITIEREGIFTQEIRHFDSSADVIEVPISNTYVPVIYVSVASYSERHGEPTHKYGEPDLDKPKGYFGVAPLFVNPYVRAFSVQIESDKNVYRPGEMATLTLTATRGGKPYEGAELTVMAVDRGVIDLINYHVPNPIDFFYSRYNFPLCVKGGDSRSMLMDPVTYSVKSLAGGDADEEKEEDERKDFRPTALFEPALVTDKNGKVTCTFKVPDSLTTYRLTAFGVKDDSFALQEEEIKVQNPINIQAVQPRKLRERDTAECGVLITNLDKSSQKVTVSIQARVPTKNTAQDELEGRITVPGFAFIDGKTEYTVNVASGDSSVVYFDVAAKEQGTVELVYTIKSDVLNEKLVSPIRIEKTYVYETVTMIGSTDDAEKAKESEAFMIPSFAKEGRGELAITLDATRLGMLGSSVNYLFDYPYGCLEQQSSRVLPLVIFEDYIDVFGLDSKVGDIHKLVTSYTNKWAKSQLSNGSFPYWPDSKATSTYVSIRIGHIVALALKNGYTTKELGIDVNALSTYLGSLWYETGYPTTDYNSAYAAYVLSLLGNTQMHTILNRLYNRKDEMSLSSVVYMALAYLNDVNSSSSIERGKALMTSVRPYLQPAERSVTITDKSRTGFYWWYESHADLLALMLQGFVKQNPDDQMVDRLLFTLMQEQSHGYWQNTATTAHVLEAVYTYIKERNLDNTNYKASVSLDGKNVMSESFEGVAAKPKTLKLPFEDEIIASLAKDKAIPLTFEKDGTGRLFYTAEMKYALPDEMLFAKDGGLKVKYEITDAKTGEVVNKNAKDDPMLKLEAGKLYKATVQLESYRDRTFVALRAPIPSGAEILDSTFVTTGSEGGIETSSSSWRHWISNKYIMDNEIQFFWDDFGSGSTSITFTFRAARRGVYPVPPVQAECMYEPEIFGRSDGYLSVIE